MLCMYICKKILTLYHIPNIYCIYCLLYIPKYIYRRVVITFGSCTLGARIVSYLTQLEFLTTAQGGNGGGESNPSIGKIEKISIASKFPLSESRVKPR